MPVVNFCKKCETMTIFLFFAIFGVDFRRGFSKSTPKNTLLQGKKKENCR